MSLILIITKFCQAFSYLYIYMYLLCVCGEGNGSPLQYSCLENPVDGGAWWAAVHRVAQSRTQLSMHRVRHNLASDLACMHACIGEGNGNPLQCSCLENPRDGGAWRAAVYGVTQSRTWLKRLSSSSLGIVCVCVCVSVSVCRCLCMPVCMIT